MKHLAATLFCLLLAAIPCGAASPEVAVDAWSRATPPGGKSGAIYGEITNLGAEAIEPQEITMPLARSAMIHETRMEDGVMRMRHATIPLGPGETATLAPGGVHIMLMGLRGSLVEGCVYPFNIRWSTGDVTGHSFVAGGIGQMGKPAAGQSDVPRKKCD